MKKIMLLGCLFAWTMWANGQTLIKANFNKGDRAVYETKMNVKANAAMGGGDNNADVTTESYYEVVEKNSEGMIIETMVTNIDQKGNNDLADQMGVTFDRYLMGVKVLLSTDGNGKILKIANKDEVLSQVSKAALADIEEKYAKHPELEKALPKINMIMSISELMTAEMLIDQYYNSGLFTLYGRTLKSGEKVDETYLQYVKTINTYTLEELPSELKVTGQMKGNMTEDDVKHFLIESMKKMGGGEEMVAQVEKGWSQMKAMGMTNMDFGGEKVFNFLQNGWISKTTLNTKVKMMGMDMTTDRTIELKSKSW
ncbi:MAG: hypothetical protein SOZ07_06190 [Prevotella sp.]|nr:hypothetical protein [Prevotellaceae bacterium]MDY3936227.1 hypothetical protein [Prevotella sp.]MDY4218088.1 hypothetical protein [Prevotella sp.]